MYDDLFFFFSFFLNISLILFCQPFCQGVLNPDKLNLFNYLNPGPRNQAQWFIPVCMRLVGGRNNTRCFDGWPMCVCVCVRERERAVKGNVMSSVESLDLLHCHKQGKGKKVCVSEKNKLWNLLNDTSNTQTFVDALEIRTTLLSHLQWSLRCVFCTYLNPR